MSQEKRSLKGSRRDEMRSLFEELQWPILDLANFGVLFLDEQMRIRYANRAANRIFGQSIKRGDALKKICHLCSEDGTCIPESSSPVLRALQTRKTVKTDCFLALPTTRVAISASVSPISIDRQRTGVAVFLRDVTKEKMAMRAVERLDRAYETISKCNAILVQATSEETLMNGICRLLISGGYALAWIGSVTTDNGEKISLIAQAAAQPKDFVRMKETWKWKSGSTGPIQQALRTGRVQVIHEKQIPPHRGSASAHEHASTAIAPIFLRGKIFGILNVCSDHADAFNAKEIALLSEMVRDVGFGILALREHADLKKAEKNLVEAQRLARVGSFTWSRSRGFVTWSPEARAIIGLDQKQLRPSVREALVWVHPDDRALVQRWVRDVVARKTRAESQFRIVRSDGSERIVIGKMKVVYDGQGKPSDVLGTLQDVSERERLEERLRRKTEEQLTLVAKYEALLASLGDAVFAVDVHGRLTYMNGAAEKLFGGRFSEAAGKPFHTIWSLEDKSGRVLRAEERPTAIALKLKKRVSTSQLVVVRSDGLHVPSTITASPIYLAGKVIGSISVFKDITRESLIDRSKDEFISLASHQLRTPLSIIKWYTDALKIGSRKVTDEKQRVYIEEIAASNERLIDLVESLLNISRIEQGRFISVPKRLDIRECIERVLKPLASKITQKQLRFHEDCPATVSIRIDPKILEIVLQNLLTNSVSYSQTHGEFGVKARVLKNRLVLQVWDTGIGIPKDAQSHLFEKFFRAENARATEPNGTGLGLYIVKTLLSVLDGTIAFTSVEGKGTTFTVEIPLNGKGEAKK